MEPNTCPHCGKILADSLVATFYKRLIAGMRRTRNGGRNGGRPRQNLAPATLQVSPPPQVIPRREPSRESDLDSGFDFGA